MCQHDIAECRSEVSGPAFCSAALTWPSVARGTRDASQGLQDATGRPGPPGGLAGLNKNHVRFKKAQFGHTKDKRPILKLAVG